MSALINLEFRRLMPLLPIAGIVLAAGVLLGMFAPSSGTHLGIVFTVMVGTVLIGRIFPVGANEYHVNVLVGTLPAARTQVISARYLTAMGVIVAAAGLTAALPTSGFLPRPAAVALIAGILGLNLVMFAPMASSGRFGNARSLVAILPYLAFAGTYAVIPQAWKDAVAFFVMNEATLSLMMAVVLLVLLVVLSWAYSVRVFSKRDL